MMPSDPNRPTGRGVTASGVVLRGPGAVVNPRTLVVQDPRITGAHTYVNTMPTMQPATNTETWLRTAAQNQMVLQSRRPLGPSSGVEAGRVTYPIQPYLPPPPPVQSPTVAHTRAAVANRLVLKSLAQTRVSNAYGSYRPRPAQSEKFRVSSPPILPDAARARSRHSSARSDVSKGSKESENEQLEKTEAGRYASNQY